MRCLMLVLLPCLAAAAESPGPELVIAANQEVADWVREKIRKPLHEHCGECHAGGKNKGGFRIDTYALLMNGGEDYAVGIRPWQPERSPMLDMIKWQGDEDLNMPPEQQLPAEVIADIARWIAMGAPWPAEEAAPEPTPKP